MSLQRCPRKRGEASSVGEETRFMLFFLSHGVLIFLRDKNKGQKMGTVFGWRLFYLLFLKVCPKFPSESLGECDSSPTCSLPDQQIYLFSVVKSYLNG